MNEHHDTEWHPPPTLDTGQNRVNDYHHPERFRMPAEDAWTPDVPATRDEHGPPLPRDGSAADDAVTQRSMPPVGPDPPLAA